MAESEEPLDEGEDESAKTGLKLNIQNNEDHGIWSNHFMENR